MSSESGKGGATVIIKKYANRRLYNTQSSSYITLEHLAQMTREGIEFKVLDAKSGAEITHQILTQIIMDEEASGEQMLPVSFLRQLIGLYGNSMQALVPHYLEASMDNFRNNQVKLHKAFEESLGNNPLAKLAQQNMAMFKAAASVFLPGATGESEAGPQSGSEAGPESGPNSGSETGPETAPRDDFETLRAQMAEMQKKLDSLGN